MAIRIRFANNPGLSLGYSIERLADGALYDHASGTFGPAEPAALVAPLPEDAGNFAGRYKATLMPTPPGQFPDGHYCVTVHDAANKNLVVGELACTMAGGDDTPSSAITDGKMDALRSDVEKAAADIVAEVRKPRPLFAGPYPQS